MASVSITNPAEDGDPFPATISGSYDVGTLAMTASGNPPPPPPPPIACVIPVGLGVTVTVTKTSDPGYKNEQAAALKCVTDTSGTWSSPAPGDLLPGQDDYVITATSSMGGSDVKTDITT